MQSSGVVLAGGASTRMGTDKRFLRLGGKPLLLWTLERLRPLVDDVVLAALDVSSFADWGVRLAADRYPGQGVLAGMHAGLAAARGEWAMVVGGDMPLLDAGLIRALLGLAATAESDVIVPEWKGELEPLHAVYRTEVCAPAAEAVLQAGKRRIVAFYPQVRVSVVPHADIARLDPEGRSFFNVNTGEDWATALRLLGLPEDPAGMRVDVDLAEPHIPCGRDTPGVRELDCHR